MKKILLVVMLVSGIDGYSQQVTLKPWTEIYGDLPGQHLGLNVTGISPSVNLPYPAAVSSGGRTSFYRLQTPTDTSAQLTIDGDFLLTGDVNGDGFTDAVVVKRQPEGILLPDTVLVYWGNTEELDTLNPLRIPQENYGDLLQPRCIGDVNNDGKDDLILGASDYPHPLSAGKVYIFLNPVTTSIPTDTLVGVTSSAGLGIRCSIADIDDDGFNELMLLGNNQFGPESSRYNYIDIYWGRGYDSLNLELGLEITGPSSFPNDLACFDANGDSIADLLWTTHDSVGYTFIGGYYGGKSFDTIPDLKLINPGLGDFGNAIANAGDMNGDGYDDIVVGAYRGSITSGFALVYGGGVNIDSVWDAGVGMSLYSFFGYSLASIDDITGDGLSEIIVGAPNYEFGDGRGYWGIFKGDSTIRVTTDVKEDENVPHQFVLYQCYPNPFNPVTTIRYDLREGGEVKLTIANVVGERIQTLVAQYQPPGVHQAYFDGTTFATGTYLYTLLVRNQYGKIFSDTKKLILMK